MNNIVLTLYEVEFHRGIRFFKTYDHSNINEFIHTHPINQCHNEELQYKCVQHQIDFIYREIIQNAK